MKLPLISSFAAGNNHLILMFLSLPIILAASSEGGGDRWGGFEEMGGSRELDQTPTWAVSLVCGVIIIISLLLEKTIYLVGKVRLFISLPIREIGSIFPPINFAKPRKELSLLL